MPLDIARWLEPVALDAPAGPNLEFDPDFGALDRAALGKPAQEFSDTVIPGAPPDWREVEALAWQLLERTRDLRVMTHLAVARLHEAGLPGFAETLALTRQMLEQHWDSVHPQLDPEDDNDPTLRANALLALAEPGRVLRSIRNLPLAESRKVGRVTWRDIAVATGIAEQSGAVEVDSSRAVMSEREIRAAFQDSDPARLTALRAALALASEEARAITSVFDARAGSGSGPDFDTLIKLLRQVAADVGRFAPEPGAVADEGVAMAPMQDAAAEGSALAPGGAPAGTGTGAAPRGASAASLGAITTRADAVRLLDLVMQYYERYEPSSPLPLLIDRARRLADKNFLDILRDLAPDGLGQAQTVAGTPNE